MSGDAIILCTGLDIAPDECQNCGGSASLGGSQEPLDTPEGRFCSAECHDDAIECRARETAYRKREWCPECGFDRFEHADNCAADAAPDAVQALADAGLLLTDADRAVLDAAEQVARVGAWRLDPKTPGYELTELGVLVQAVRARREALAAAPDTVTP